MVVTATEFIAMISAKQSCTTVRPWVTSGFITLIFTLCRPPAGDWYLITASFRALDVGYLLGWSKERFGTERGIRRLGSRSSPTRSSYSTASCIARWHTA